MRELYGTRACPYTSELRDELDWQERDFIEYDVEVDADALRRITQLCGGTLSVPVLVEDGRVVQVGVAGRSCYVSPG